MKDHAQCTERMVYSAHMHSRYQEHLCIGHDVKFVAQSNNNRSTCEKRKFLGGESGELASLIESQFFVEGIRLFSHFQTELKRIH